jgi:hypothetical protein
MTPLGVADERKIVQGPERVWVIPPKFLLAEGQYSIACTMSQPLCNKPDACRQVVATTFNVSGCSSPSCFALIASTRQYNTSASLYCHNSVDITQCQYLPPGSEEPVNKYRLFPSCREPGLGGIDLGDRLD